MSSGYWGCDPVEGKKCDNCQCEPTDAVELLKIEIVTNLAENLGVPVEFLLGAGGGHE